MESTNNSISSDLILLVFVLGIISIIINLYGLYKKDNEFTGRILTPQQTLKTVDEYLESDEGISYMNDTFNNISKTIDLIIIDDSKNTNTYSNLNILKPDKKLQFSLSYTSYPGHNKNSPPALIYVTYDSSKPNTASSNTFTISDISS